MELIVSTPPTSLPSIFTAQPQAKKRMRDFFSSHIRNKNTRRAYLEAVHQFSAFCAVHGIEDPGVQQSLLKPLSAAKVAVPSRSRLRRTCVDRAEREILKRNLL